MTGIENLTPAPEAAPAVSTPPARRVAAAASSRHGSHALAASEAGFSGAPEDNPLFTGANSKTIDVP